MKPSCREIIFCEDRNCRSNVLYHEKQGEYTDVSMRFGNCVDQLEMGKSLTLDEAGQIFCLTRERIRQIEEKALYKFYKNMLRIKDLKDELDAMALKRINKFIADYEAMREKNRIKSNVIKRERRLENEETVHFVAG